MGYFIALFLLLIIASLATAGFFMLRRPPEGAPNESASEAKKRGMVRALTVRISLSVALFLIVLLSWQLGWIHPTGLPLTVK
jgi:type VI protein secretion system component VasF